MKTHLTGFQFKDISCGTPRGNVTTENHLHVTCERCKQTRNFKSAQVRHEREGS